MKRKYYIDSSALVHIDCPRKFVNIVCKGLRKGDSHAANFGSLFHKIIKEYKATGKMNANKFMDDFTLLDSAEDFRNSILMIDVLNKYRKALKTYGMPTLTLADVPILEKTFCFRVYEGGEYEVYVCGTIDEIGIMGGKTLCIVDRKVTAWREAYYNIDEWLAKWRLSYQMHFYTWVLRSKEDQLKELGYDVENSRIMIEGVFLAASSPAKVKFSDLLEPDEGVLARIDNDVNRAKTLIMNFENNKFGEGVKNLRQCATYIYDDLKLGRCPFSCLCESTDKDTIKMMEDSYFEKKPYEPLNFDN